MRIKTRFTQKARKPRLVFLEQIKKKKKRADSQVPNYPDKMGFGNPPKETMFYRFLGVVRWGVFCPSWDINFDDLHLLLSSHLSNCSRAFQTEENKDWCSRRTHATPCCILSVFSVIKMWGKTLSPTAGLPRATTHRMLWTDRTTEHCWSQRNCLFRPASGTIIDLKVL